MATGCGGEIHNKMLWESSGARFPNVWKRARRGAESKTRGGSVVQPVRRRPGPSSFLSAPQARPPHLPTVSRFLGMPPPLPAPGVRAGRQGPIRARPSALQGASLPGAAGRRAGSGCAGLRGPCLARVAMELRQCGRRPAGCPGPGRGARG